MTMTMIDIAEAASRNASVAYAAQRFSLSMAFTGALALAKDALEAEAAEKEATLALFSCFATEEEEAEALEAEREAASSAAWARMAAFSAWESAQASFHAEEEEEIASYKARQAVHEAALALEEEEEEEGWGDIAIEAMLRGLSAGDREWICGEEDPVAIAREWGDQGFQAREVREWVFVARCFRAASAGALKARGLTPEDCAVGTSNGDTLGYMVANGDLSSAGAARALQG